MHIHIHGRGRIRVSDDWNSALADIKRLELDNSAFDALIQRLRGDGSLKQQDWQQIASSYLGFSLAASTPKAKSIQLIVQTQALNARQIARAPFQV